MKADRVMFWQLDEGESRAASLFDEGGMPVQFERTRASSADKIVERLENHPHDVLLIEDVFPFQRTRQWLKLTDDAPGRPVVVTIAHTINVPTAVSLMEHGVFTVVTGDATREVMYSAIHRALENRRSYQKIMNMSQSLLQSKGSLEKKTLELVAEKVKLRRKVSEVTVMRSVAEWLGKSRTQEDGLKEVISPLSAFIGAASGVLLVSPEKDRWIEADNGVPEIHRLLLLRTPDHFRKAVGLHLAPDTMRMSIPPQGQRALCNAVAFPIRIKRRFLGYGIFWGNELPAPEPETLRLLEAVGVQIGAFCENVALQEQVAIDRDRQARANEELNFLLRLASSLHEDTELDAVFEWLCHEIGRFVPCAGMELISVAGIPAVRVAGYSDKRGEMEEESGSSYGKAWEGQIASQLGTELPHGSLSIKEFPFSSSRPMQKAGQGRWESILSFGGNRLGVLVVHLLEATVADRVSERVLKAVSSQLGLFLHNSSEREKVRDMAVHDGLTGLYNYRSFRDLFDREFQRHLRYGRNLSVMMIDLDNFKQVNDRFGHQAGDRVLQKMAEILLHNLRKTDYAFRVGGDEFVVLMPDRDAPQAEVLGERIRVAVKGGLLGPPPHDFRISVSIGITDCAAISSKNSEDLLTVADGALYRAKNSGRDRIQLAEIPSCQNGKALVHV